ncbi:RAMP superfamily CRISPR-associated protein [Thauera butanivorans]|jgi:CRISPR-associated protein Cmr1|uniref:RAMP superfamily CRISPR-associated protein n=1 Tax=Thauera butanivorans TaxID=86174 RepID=UPI0008384F90|nr:RAMP superfamily CRISPR-associated protein [Thauera butanivorans]
MKTLRYHLSLQTPAFLGNASQQAQWRTPPIKALLRQWWRVAYAAEKRFDVDVAAMRRKEGLLFGRADEDSASKSQIRLRLSHWSDGTLAKNQWPIAEKITHKEVKNRDGQPAPVGSDLYLGYGPLVYDAANRKTALKANAALQAGEHATLSLACPDESASLIEQALCLLDRFAAMGGRSRNGWGSFHLKPQDGTPALQAAMPLRDWRQALTLDWPHAIGQDGKGALIWQTRPVDDWKALMKELAALKIGLRTQFKFTTGKDALRPEDRHWLSYPITNHSVRNWGGNARLPNSLRFKVRPAPGDAKRIVGVAFHVPHLPPPTFSPEPETLLRVWRQVHSFLDDPDQKLSRIPA